MPRLLNHIGIVQFRNIYYTNELSAHYQTMYRIERWPQFVVCALVLAVADPQVIHRSELPSHQWGY